MSEEDKNIMCGNRFVCTEKEMANKIKENFIRNKSQWEKCVHYVDNGKHEHFCGEDCPRKKCECHI